jgi:hypothetical protein
MVASCSAETGRDTYFTTETVKSVRIDEVCFDRLDEKVNAEDVRCARPSDTPGSGALTVGECVRIERRKESAYVVSVEPAQQSSCESAGLPTTTGATVSPSASGATPVIEEQ